VHFPISPNIKKEGGAEMKAVSVLLALLVGVVLAIPASELEGSIIFFLFFFLVSFFRCCFSFLREPACIFLSLLVGTL
jgi:prolipoprotein diacylglyceryltransferase